VSLGRREEEKGKSGKRGQSTLIRDERVQCPRSNVQRVSLGRREEEEGVIDRVQRPTSAGDNPRSKVQDHNKTFYLHLLFDLGSGILDFGPRYIKIQNPLTSEF